MFSLFRLFHNEATIDSLGARSCTTNSCPTPVHAAVTQLSATQLSTQLSTLLSTQLVFTQLSTPELSTDTDVRGPGNSPPDGIWVSTQLYYVYMQLSTVPHVTVADQQQHVRSMGASSVVAESAIAEKSARFLRSSSPIRLS